MSRVCQCFGILWSRKSEPDSSERVTLLPETPARPAKTKHKTILNRNCNPTGQCEDRFNSMMASTSGLSYGIGMAMPRHVYCKKKKRTEIPG